MQTQNYETALLQWDREFEPERCRALDEVITGMYSGNQAQVS